MALEADAPAKKKTFKDYEPGFIHIDIKYLPQMSDESSRRYLFVAIERATRWVFMEIYDDQSDSSSTDFLINVKHACPVTIVKLSTDNGSQFIDRYTSRKKGPRASRSLLATTSLIAHASRWTSNIASSRHAIRKQTACWSSEVIYQTRFAYATELESTLRGYLKIDNNSIP